MSSKFRASIFFSSIATALLVAAAPMTLSQGSSSNIVSWKTMVGSQQPGNMVGAGAAAIPGAGQPFTATGGVANLDLGNGFLRMRLEGLSFAGGNFIGTTGPFTSLRPVLLFDVDGSASGGEAVRVDLPATALSACGDLAFGGFVNLPAVAQTESDIALLLVNGGDMFVAHGSIRVD